MLSFVLLMIPPPTICSNKRLMRIKLARSRWWNEMALPSGHTEKETPAGPHGDVCFPVWVGEGWITELGSAGGSVTSALGWGSLRRGARLPEPSEVWWDQQCDYRTVVVP